MNSGYITIVTGGANSTINVSGDVNISGGTLCMHEDASATTATLNLGGDFTFSGGSITEVTGRPGVIIFNNTTTVQNFRRTGGTITNNVSFTVNPNVTVDFGASDVVNGGGRFTLSDGANLQTANISGINGTIQTSTRTLSTLANYTFDGAAAQNTGSYLPATVNNFTINNINGVALSQALTVNGTYTSNGQFSSAFNITFNGPTNCGGSINASAGTVTYANANPNVIAGTYNNLSIASGVTTATLCGAINVNGNLSINGTSTLYTSAFQITGNAAGTFTMASGSTLRLGNTGSPTAVLFPTNFTTGNIILNSNSTVIYQSSGNQTISAVPFYGNLTTATGGSKILANNITVNGNLLIGAGSTLDASSGNNYSITLYGSWNHQGTFEERQGTVIFTGSNTQTITSAFSTEEFYNITVNKTGGVLRPINSSQSVQAHGNFYIQNGTYETNGAVLTVDQLTTIAGTLSTNGGTANLNNVSFAGGTIGNASVTGTVNISGTLVVSAGNGTIGRVNLNVAGTTTIAATRTLSFDNSTGTKIFTGLVTNNGIWNNSANGNITFRGGLTHNGSTFTSGTGTYSFTTNTQTLGGTSAITFNGGVTVSSTLNNANTTTIRGILGGAGIWNNNNGSTLNYENATAPMAGGTFNVNTNSNTVNYTSSAAQDLRAATYYNLITSGGGIKNLLGNTTVDGTLTMTSGNISTGANTLILDNYAASSLSYASGIIIGNFERYVNQTGQDYLFPVGVSGQIHSLTMRFQNLAAGSILVQYIAGDPGNSGLPLTDGDGTEITDQYTTGYWTAQARNSLTSSNYRLTLDATGFGPWPINAGTRVISRTGTGLWTLDGGHSDAAGSLLRRNALNGISGAAGGTQFGAGRPAPKIISQPVSQTVCEGSNTGFSVTATGAAPLTYQWYKAPAIPLTDDGHFGGTVSANLTISSVVAGDIGNYYCIVTDKNGNSRQSNSASLIINPRPSPAISGALTVCPDVADIIYSTPDIPGKFV